ncbi:Histidine kinase-, DNA gyrase B-, and HSP90-like ATPase [Burkholderia sp. YR290]|nr:Histidine kinase-, DNA gyrase B-, and HSP90-like ATPase [Burkholderia sp. YR290]
MPIFARYIYEESTRAGAAVKVRRGVALPSCRQYLFALTVCLSLHAYAADPWRVVILPGADPTQPAALDQIRAMRSELIAAAPDGVEFYTDSLDGLRFDTAAVMPDFLNLMKKKYQHRHVDIVIGIADFALEFTARYHQDIWPGAPVVITSVQEERLNGMPADFARVPMRIDVAGTLTLAETLQPQARRLVVVAGTTPFDRFWGQQAADAARRRATRNWTVEVWNGLAMPELRRRLAALDLNTAVLYTTMYRDQGGRTYFPYEVVGPMTEVSGAPVYSWYPTYLEHGLTGGSVVSFETNGRLAGELATSILLGKTSPHGATWKTGPSHCAVNVGRMEKLGLPMDALPAGCELTNVPPSLWREYRGTTLTALAVLAMQAVTIVALLRQRRQRRLAEDETALRRNELARAARFASAGELSASIAHEVGQPLGAILSNADAAELMLQEPSPEIAELHAIVADVRRDALRANQVVQRLRALLEKQTVALGSLELDATVNEAFALLGPEARRRRLTIESSLAAGDARILGDRIQLEQVLLNLAINAMDAMQDTAASERILSIATRPADRGYELTVADRGHGIPADAKARLFDSLYTTKPHGMGLGLSIVRTIVTMHGGRIWVDAREGGGSIFTVWLPEIPASAAAYTRPGHTHRVAASDPMNPPQTTQGGNP